MLSKLSLWTLSLLVICGCNISVNGQSGVGLSVTKDATAASVGLPVYPGATLAKDTSEDSSVRLGMWAGTFGFKLAVMKLESPDSPTAIAHYYQKALEKYGPVLDCGASRPRVVRTSASSLSCDHDKPKPGEWLFKSGTEDDQHIVAVEPRGAGTRFHLVYVKAHD